MRNRQLSYSDWGFMAGEEDSLIELVRDPDNLDARRALLDCAIESNAQLANDIFYSIVEGLSYDKIINLKYIAIAKKDFYGYRRKALALLKKKLEEQNV